MKCCIENCGEEACGCIKHNNLDPGNNYNEDNEGSWDGYFYYCRKHLIDFVGNKKRWLLEEDNDK